MDAAKDALAKHGWRYLKDLKQFAPGDKPSFVSMRGYANALVWSEGLRRAGKDLTREKFIDALEHMKNADLGLGPGMELSYSQDDHLGLHKVFFVTVKNGQISAVTDWKEVVKQ